MNRMWRRLLPGAVMVCLGVVLSAHSDEPKTPEPKTSADATSEGTVTVGGVPIEYRAVAGTLTVGATDAEDATLGLDGAVLPDAGQKLRDSTKPEEAPATAR